MTNEHERVPFWRTKHEQKWIHFYSEHSEHCLYILKFQQYMFDERNELCLDALVEFFKNGYYALIFRYYAI